MTVGRKRGYRDPHQETVDKKHHSMIKTALLESENGLTRKELFLKTKLSRPPIRKHVEDFKSSGEVIEYDRKLFHAENKMELVRQNAQKHLRDWFNEYYRIYERAPSKVTFDFEESGQTFTILPSVFLLSKKRSKEV